MRIPFAVMHRKNGVAGAAGAAGAKGDKGDTGNSIITFALAGNLTVGDGLTNPKPMAFAGTLESYILRAVTAPTGANAVFEVNIHDKTTGAVKSTTTITLTAGQAKIDLTTIETPPAFVAGDYLTLDCTGIGSTVAGADVTIVLTTEAA